MPVQVAGKNLSNGDIALAAGGILGFLATFFPWYSYSYNGCQGLGASYCGLGGSYSYAGSALFWGWLAMIAAVLVLALLGMRLFMGQVNLTLPLQDWLLFVIFGGVMLAGTLIYFLTTPNPYGGIDIGNVPGLSKGPSWGWFLALVAGAAALAGGFLKKSDPQPETKPLNIQTTPSAAYAGPPPAAPPAAPPVAPPPAAPPPQAPPMETPPPPPAPPV